ncbi:MAG: NmrA family transcriptional regulator [Planctomycetota bacterium]
MPTTPHTANQPILVTGATGKTGSRVLSRLEALGHAVRPGSRQAEVPFDWDDPRTWDAALAGCSAAYLCYFPDLSVPQAPATLAAFAETAAQHNLQRMVLLSGRGEPEAQKAEQLLLDAGQRHHLDVTVVRASWFAQNFTEGIFVDDIRSRRVAFPVALHDTEVAEPFIDIDDIAAVAVAALTQPGHAGEVYDVTGPRLLTLPQAVGAIAEALGEPIRYTPITPDQFAAGLAEQGVPEDFIELLNFLFNELLDGRNAHLSDGVQRALGRPPRDFMAFAQAAAKTDVWNTPQPA